MQIVDAQIHLWGTGLPSNLSHRQVTPFTPEEAIALMDEGGVDAAVIHPPGWDPNSTEMAFAAVQDYPGRFAIMGALPLDRPESRAPHRKLATTTGHARPALRVPQRSGAAVAARWHDRLAVGGSRKGRRSDRDAGDRLADRNRPDRRAPSRASPDDRSPGRPRRHHDAERRRGDDPHAGSFWHWRSSPMSRSRRPACRLIRARPIRFRRCTPFLRQIYDAFGPHRMFWGTDITKMPCSWRQCVTMFTEELPWLQGRDLELVMGEALCAWWGWNRAG